MSDVTILDNEFATLKYHPDTKIVHHQFHKFIHDKEFRKVLEKGAEIFEQKGANKWLSDDRGNSALTPEDTEWATTVWFPRVKGAGWQYWAVVMPEKVVGQMNMERWIKLYADLGVTAQAFTDPDEAMTWLAAQ